MSRAQLTKHYQRIASSWPKDPMRPEQPITRLVDCRQKQIDSASDSALKSELRSVNALYSLLDGRYSKKYPTPRHVLEPQSNPEHYTGLVAELEKAPTRGWWGNFITGLKGRIRFS